jgi:hypothetical protein
MLVFAVEAEQKLRNLPIKNLVYLGLGILALIAVVSLIKHLAKIGPLILVLVSAAALLILAMSWVYNRTEPKFLTPFVDSIAPFFPSASAAASQRSAPAVLPKDKKPAAPAPPPPKKVY